MSAPKPSLKIEFPSKSIRDRFLSWMSDGGGEYNFFEYCDDHLEDTESVGSIDYSYAFPAWGYKPEVDGEPRIIVRLNK